MAKSEKTMAVLIDADSLCYAAGFAAQHDFYLLTHTPEHGTLHHEVVHATSRAELESGRVGAVEMIGLTGAYRTWHRREVEPPENAMHSVKLQIERAFERIKEKVPGYELAGPGVYLTGKDNFRDKIATIKPYKGNRDPDKKPVLLPVLRQYLVEHWDALIVEGEEADDHVATMQTKLRGMHGPNGSIIVGIDKDLLQIPGLHYNPHLDKFANISEAVGDCNFYRQVLIGDQSDNVKGCHLIGEAKAKAAILSSMSCEEMASICLDLFTQSVHKYGGNTYNGLSPADALLETGRLLWLRRKPGDEWTLGKGARVPNP